MQWTGNAAHYNNTHACQQQQLRVRAPSAGDAAAAAAAAATARAAPAARLRSAAAPALTPAPLCAACLAGPSQPAILPRGASPQGELREKEKLKESAASMRRRRSPGAHGRGV